MVELSAFLSREVNSHVRNVILNEIERVLSSKTETSELVLNVYSLEFFPLENRVVIYDDIDPDDEQPLNIQLDEFHRAIRELDH